MGISLIDLIVATRGQGFDLSASPSAADDGESASSFLQALVEAQAQLLSHAGAQVPVDVANVIADASVNAPLPEIEADTDASDGETSVEAALLAMLAQMQSAVGGVPIPSGGQQQDTASASSLPASGGQTVATASPPGVVPDTASAGMVLAMLGDAADEVSQPVTEDATEMAPVPPSSAGTSGTAARTGPAVVWIDGLSLHVEQPVVGNSSAVARVKSASTEAGKLTTAARVAPAATATNAAQDASAGAALLEEAALRSRAVYVVQTPVIDLEGPRAALENAVAEVDLPPAKPVQTDSGAAPPPQSFPGVSMERSAAPASGDVAPQSHVRNSNGVTAPNRSVTLDALADQTVRSIRYLAGREDGTLTVRLIPESLGEMHIEVHSNGDQMTVRLASSNAAVRHSMEANVPQLRDSLSRDGLQVTRIEVAANLASQAGTDHAGGRGDAYQAAPPPRHYAGYTAADQNAQEPDQGVRRLPTHQGLVNLFV